MDDIGEFMRKQKQDAMERQFHLFAEGAKNTMRAVLICIQDGDYDEAEQLIKDALGEGE